MNGDIVNKLFLPVILFLAFIFSPFTSSAQQIIVTEEGDTLVTITPEHVHIINSAFSDVKWLEEKSRVQAEEIELLERRIERADTVILNYALLVGELKEEMGMRELAYQNVNKKDKRKAFWLGGVGGILIGVIATLIIAR